MQEATIMRMLRLFYGLHHFPSALSLPGRQHESEAFFSFVRDQLSATDDGSVEGSTAFSTSAL